MEFDIAELDVTGLLDELDRLLRFGNRRLLFEHTRDLLERRRRRLERVVEHRETLHRVKEALRIEDRGGQHTETDRAAKGIRAG